MWCRTKGWNAQQGFYIYRNRRMIVAGGYLNFDLKAEEHYKLARIKLILLMIWIMNGLLMSERPLQYLLTV